MPTEPPEGVGQPAEETVKIFPVEMGMFTELPLGDCGVWKDCVAGTVVDEPLENAVDNVGVDESEGPVCEDFGVE